MKSLATPLFITSLSIVACGGPPETTTPGDDAGIRTDGSDVDPAALARAVAFVNGCLLEDDVQASIEHAWAPPELGPRFRADIRSNVDCINRLDSCDAGLFECIGVELAFYAECPSGCSDGIAVDCDSGIRIDCARTFGGGCDPTGTSCDIFPESALCDPSVEPLDQCVDGRAISCTPSDSFGGLRSESPVCAEVGLVCRDDDELIGCVSATLDPTCDGGSDPDRNPGLYDGDSCDGDHLERCGGGGRVSIDCTTMHADARCVEMGERAFCGFAAECDPADPRWVAGTCDGMQFTFCNRGRLETLDCDELGLLGCDPLGGCTLY